MKHILIILISILLLSSPLYGQKISVLYFGQWNGVLGWFENVNYKDKGIKYIGLTENGKPSGMGKSYYPDGRNYVGEWEDGGLHGQGIMTWSNGIRYEGEWKDGEQNGQGTYTNPNGIMYDGE